MKSIGSYLKFFNPTFNSVSKTDSTDHSFTSKKFLMYSKAMFLQRLAKTKLKFVKAILEHSLQTTLNVIKNCHQYPHQYNFVHSLTAFHYFPKIYLPSCPHKLFSTGPRHFLSSCRNNYFNFMTNPYSIETFLAN